jgi:nucleotide-binding universal stress UspA family protein
VERNADFLVVGTKGRGALSRLVLGDTTHDIIKRTPCPVVVVPRSVHA